MIKYIGSRRILEAEISLVEVVGILISKVVLAGSHIMQNRLFLCVFVDFSFLLLMPDLPQLKDILTYFLEKLISIIETKRRKSLFS